MKQYHIIYKTTNIVNNKIYIGLHSTNKLNDGYIGSGKILKKAIKKYGKDKFVREILYLFRTRDEARKMEASIVTTEFCNRKDTYNLIEGGSGVGIQTGSNNHMYGKIGIGAKRVKAMHKDGTIIIANNE